MKIIPTSIRITILLAFLVSCSSPSNKQASSISDEEVQNEEQVSIDDIISISEGFTSSYTIKQEEDLTYSNIDRRQARVVIPSGLTKEQVEDNIKAATLEIFNKYSTAGISILVYEEGDNYEAAYTVGMGEFTPYGDWGKVANGISLDKYELKIDLNEPYFQPKQKIFKAGDEFVFYQTERWDRKQKKDIQVNGVLLSRSADSWVAEDIILEVPNNTTGKIIDLKSWKFPDGSTSVRYKVSVKVDGSSYNGWINSEEVK